MILQIKSALSGLQERIKSYIKKISIENRHFTKMASFAIIGAFIPLSVLPAMADQNQTTFKSNVVLSKNSQIVDVAVKTPTIVPGDSQDQIAARVAAENAAKAAQVAKAAKSAKTTVTRVYNDPANIDVVYQTAGAAYGISWQVLKGINYVETGCVGSTTKTNPSGAGGPFQFMPGTWEHWKVDANGDGYADRNNIVDAAYTAARYLAASGGSANRYKTALWSYNPSSSYFNKVMSVAQSLGF